MLRWLTWQVLSLASAVAGVMVAAYLSIIHYRQDLLVCGLSDCSTVQESRYAELFGIPVAILGLAMYLTIAALAIGRIARPERAADLTTAAFALALGGTLFAAYLTYVELWVIHAVCQWCVLSAALTVAILVVEGIGVRRLVLPVPTAAEHD